MLQIISRTYQLQRNAISVRASLIMNWKNSRHVYVKPSNTLAFYGPNCLFFFFSFLMKQQSLTKKTSFKCMEDTKA